MVQQLAGIIRWMATTLMAAVLAAAIVLTVTWAVMATDNPVRDGIKARAVQCAKEELRQFVFGSPAE